MSKKGLSPVIATVLLISLALILAVIIFIWARSFVSEKLEKEGKPIEFVCEDILFEADAILGENNEIIVSIENDGDVPLYGVDVRIKGQGSIESVGSFTEESGDSTITSGSLRNGETGSVSIEDAGIGEGEIIVVPIIIGEAGDIKKQYTCDEKYGMSAEII